MPLVTEGRRSERWVSVRPQIERFFESSPQRIYSRSALADLLNAHRERWRLPESVGLSELIDFLLEQSALKLVELSSKKYKGVVRYAWSEVRPYELGLSIRKGAYLSHGSAMFLHGLTDQLPKTIYVNQEQSPKPLPATSLSQEGIDRAFARPQRQSSFVLQWADWRYVLISGKFTDRLEVSTLRGPSGELLDTTKLERTLIDISVRPAYAGGVFQVMTAFREAQSRASAKVLVATLKKLEYVYPYHQAIGFYMTRAGYDRRALDLLRRLGLKFDFYLTHGLTQKEYDPEWRLYYPKGL